MTKREAFEIAMQVMNTSENENKADVVEVISKEIERLSAPRKKSQTKTQKENIENVENVFNALASLGHPATVTELVKLGIKNTNGEEMTSSKITAMLTKLKAENRVERTIDKKTSYYNAITTIANETEGEIDS